VQQENEDLTFNRTYRIILTTAILLFLATLTVAILTILIARAREENHRVEFSQTLTAVFDEAYPSGPTTAETATPAPQVVLGQFPFGTASAPAYSAAETCDYQIVTGNVVNLYGDPVDALQVKVWGDYSPLVFLRIGEVEPGWWGLRLDSMINRRLWVQLINENRYLSAPVEIVFSAWNCNENRVEVDFKQIEPWEY
jgi:hypothetical protein